MDTSTNDTVIVEVAPNTDAEYEAAIDNMIAEMERIRERMADDQREIECLRVGTRAALTQLKAV